MSFILDALKKSETERQQQTGGEFSAVPSRSGEEQSFKWLWILALLLLVNVAVLVGILLQPDKPAAEPADASDAPPPQSQVAEPSFEEQIAVAKQNQPDLASAAAVKQEPQSAPAVSTTVMRPATRSTTTRVLTIDEVRLNGSLEMTDLHLDIHVYSDDPAERFVFINMAKHREQSRLEEGPQVIEIRPDGVILEYQGTTFLLPRE
jgi:general secretion pathway protein B